MINLGNPYLYLKGTCNVNVRDIQTGDVVFASSKVMTNNINTEVDMGAIRAGLGNPIAIQLPSNSAVNIDLTTGDFDLKARGMQVGSQVSYNAIVSKCVSVTANGNTLALPAGSEPVADYGMNAAYAYVTGGDNNGQAYLIGDDGAIENFVAISGTTYTVQYFERQANAQALPISAMFAPGVYHVTAQMAVYSTNGGNGENRGSQVGWAYMIIPRMQFSGNASTNGSQTDAATTVLSGTALSYEEAAKEGVCQDCLYPNLAYMTYVPMSLADGSITGLAVVGGGVDLAAGATAVLPVKFVMRDNSLVQPNYSQLTYDVEDDSVATVADGLVTAGNAGTTQVTIAYKEDDNIKTQATITVE